MQEEDELILQVNVIPRADVECDLDFAGFLVFHCPLKSDAVEVLKMLADSSHRCIMITGDNPLTAVHVAKDVEIVDREAMILDLKEGTTTDGQSAIAYAPPTTELRIKLTQ